MRRSRYWDGEQRAVSLFRHIGFRQRAISMSDLEQHLFENVARCLAGVSAIPREAVRTITTRLNPYSLSGEKAATSCLIGT